MFKRPFVLTLLSVLIISGSVYFDYGSESWFWLQRSGSIITVLGAIMGIRSFFRLGIEGLGGATPFAEIVTVKDSHVEDGKIMVDVELDEETVKARKEDRKDKVSMLIGVFHVILGTIIWGYGDLLGRLF